MLVSQNIQKALSVCSKPTDRALPKAVSDVDAMLLRLTVKPGVEIRDLVANLAETSLDAWDADFAQAATIYAQRKFLGDAQANGLRVALEKRRVQAIAESIPEVIKRLQPVFDQAVADLTSASAALPEGAAALDPTAVLEDQAGGPFLVARKALETLTLIGQAHAVRTHARKGLGNGARVVALVALPPTTEVELMHPLTDGRLNTPEVLATNKRVREATQAFYDTPHLALLGIVRGEYGQDIHLSLARDAEEVEARLTHLSRASLYKRVPEHEYQAAQR